MDVASLNITTRLEIVQDIASKAEFLKGPLVGALTNCLDADEIANGLMNLPQSSPLFQRALFRTLARDEKRLVAVRKRVLRSLLNQIKQANYKDARTLARIIAEFVTLGMPPADYRHVTFALLNSRYSQVRGLGYKIVRQGACDCTLDSALKSVWLMFKDPLCADLIVNRMSDEFLLSEFDSLDSALTGTVPKARLYIRIAKRDPLLFDRLKKTDEVAWTYAIVKLGQPPISSKEAIALFWRNEIHPELALLLWCFGQMKLWDVLLEIASQQRYFSSLEYLQKKCKFPSSLGS
jgi:hypothetical protein